MILERPEEPGQKYALTFTILVHVGPLAFLFFGVQWKHRPRLSPREGKGRTNQYPPEFEAAWAAYPKRAGDNPKQKAGRAWRARVAAGVAPKAMHTGVLRYAAYVRATGKEGTEFVKQAASFFGPDHAFLNDWSIPHNGSAVPATARRGTQPDGSYVDAGGNRWKSPEMYLREQAGAAYEPEMLDRLLASESGGQKCARAA